MGTARELLAANLHGVFGNRDAASRRLAIDATYTEGVTFTDPEGTVTGRDALEAKAAAIIDPTPEDFVFAPQGVEYFGPDTAAVAWAFGPAGAPVARGLDIIRIENGQIAALQTLLHE
jgi:hypothetical protein